jgi:MFS family permease
VGVVCLVGQQLLADSALVVFEIGDVTIRQTIVPERLLGRVNAGMRVTGVGAQLAGTIAGALVAEAIGLRAALYLGAALGAVGAIALAASPARSLGELPAAVEPSGKAAIGDQLEEPVDTI